MFLKRWQPRPSEALRTWEVMTKQKAGDQRESSTWLPVAAGLHGRSGFPPTKSRQWETKLLCPLLPGFFPKAAVVARLMQPPPPRPDWSASLFAHMTRALGPSLKTCMIWHSERVGLFLCHLLPKNVSSTARVNTYSLPGQYNWLVAH